ncbi:unnamed protein product [Gulo gulo]|uniref:Uncharacterized protein n=1 Tax=Gulo gulo TaxID=48420 RepID=A0A9X9Q7R9_GULGU|nr:unnamed protein product [Gulo gulo]
MKLTSQSTGNTQLPHRPPYCLIYNISLCLPRPLAQARSGTATFASRPAWAPPPPSPGLHTPRLQPGRLSVLGQQPHSPRDEETEAQRATCEVPGLRARLRKGAGKSSQRAQEWRATLPLCGCFCPQRPGTLATVNHSGTGQQNPEGEWGKGVISSNFLILHQGNRYQGREETCQGHQQVQRPLGLLGPPMGFSYGSHFFKNDD